MSSEIGGKVEFAGPREIVLGAIELKVGEHILLIEALRSVKGVTDEELDGRASLVVSGNEILVPLPHILLKAKLANALELDQGERQDVKHVRLLAVVLREYLLDISEVATFGTERELLQIVREAVRVAKSEGARSFEEAHGLRFEDYPPLKAMESSTPKIASFAKLEFKKRYEP